MPQEKIHLAIKSYFQTEGYDFDELEDDYQIRNTDDVLFKVITVPDPLKREGYYYLDFNNKGSLYAHRMKMSKTVLINPALDKSRLKSVLKEISEPFIVQMDEFWTDLVPVHDMLGKIKHMFEDFVSAEPETKVYQNERMVQMVIAPDEKFQKTVVSVFSVTKIFYGIKFEVGSQEFMLNVSRFVTPSQEDSLKRVVKEVIEDGWARSNELFNFEVLVNTVYTKLQELCALQEPPFQDPAGHNLIAGKLDEDECPEFRGAEMVINFFELEEFRFVHLLIDNVFLTNEYFISAETLDRFTSNLETVLKETVDQVASAAESVKDAKIKEVTFEDIFNEIKEAVGDQMELAKEEEGHVEFWAGGRPAILLQEDKRDDRTEGFVVTMKNLLVRDMANSNSKQYYIHPENGFDQLEFMKPSLYNYIDSLNLETIEDVRLRKPAVKSEAQSEGDLSVGQSQNSEDMRSALQSESVKSGLDESVKTSSQKSQQSGVKSQEQSRQSDDRGELDNLSSQSKSKKRGQSRPVIDDERSNLTSSEQKSQRTERSQQSKKTTLKAGSEEVTDGLKSQKSQVDGKGKQKELDRVLMHDVDEDTKTVRETLLIA